MHIADDDDLPGIGADDEFDEIIDPDELEG